MPEQIYTSLLIQIYETKNALTFFFSIGIPLKSKF